MKRIDRNAREYAKIEKKYRESDEAKDLRKKTSDELAELYKNDKPWARPSFTGDWYIAAMMTAKVGVISEILQERGVKYDAGEFRP